MKPVTMICLLVAMVISISTSDVISPKCSADQQLEWNHTGFTARKRVLDNRHDDVRTRRECETLCLVETRFDCLSYFYSTSSLCYLDTEKEGLEEALPGQTHEYGEWTCTARRCPTGNQLVWMEFYGLVVEGRNKQTRPGVADVAGCQSLCLLETGFDCKSVEFFDKTCTLTPWRSPANKLNAVSEGIIFAQWSCVEKCQAELFWLLRYGAQIQRHNTKTIGNTASVENCKSLCLMEKSFSCLSFEYSFVKNECVLSAASSLNASLVEFDGGVFGEWYCSGPYAATTTSTPDSTTSSTATRRRRPALSRNSQSNTNHEGAGAATSVNATVNGENGWVFIERWKKPDGTARHGSLERRPYNKTKVPIQSSQKVFLSECAVRCLQETRCVYLVFEKGSDRTGECVLYSN